MKANSPSTDTLNEKRRLAVKLRLEGRKLKEIGKLVDLSSPTIIAAHKQFLKGGWEAVDVSSRGRPSGEKSTPEDLLATLCDKAFGRPESQTPWSYSLLAEQAQKLGADTSARTIGKYVEQWKLVAGNLYKAAKSGDVLMDWLNTDYKKITANARKQDSTIFWAGLATCTRTPDKQTHDKQIKKYLYAHSTKGQYLWLAGNYKSDAEHFTDFFERLLNLKPGLTVIWNGHDPTLTSSTKEWLDKHPEIIFYQHPQITMNNTQKITAENYSDTESDQTTESPTIESQTSGNAQQIRNPMTLSHLKRLEAESIHIMRETIAAAEKPAMLYSLGKDSSVMLHLAQKAFYPAKPPFPLVHVDTGWKFQAMYEFRDKIAKEAGLELIVHKNIEGIEKGVNPFTHGSSIHTDILKTEALKQALDKYGFDITFGGARRDEEKSRAKERILSFRNEQHRWDPKNQRPELWNLYNTNTLPGESIRAFPLSNWTELDIWQYIQQENIPVVPLYFSAKRPVVLRDDTWIMVDDDRMKMNEGETPIMKQVRFRTLGCYPLTGAVESDAVTVQDVIKEMLLSNNSERQGRMIDHDSSASMEKKKQEGYF